VSTCPPSRPRIPSSPLCSTPPRFPLLFPASRSSRPLFALRLPIRLVRNWLGNGVVACWRIWLRSVRSSSSRSSMCYQSFCCLTRVSAGSGRQPAASGDWWMMVAVANSSSSLAVVAHSAAPQALTTKKPWEECRWWPAAAWRDWWMMMDG
jgi:hypothetical protein